MAYNPDAFAREVDEELREDRLKTIWRRYGLYIVAGAIALVLGTAGSVGWNAWKQNQRLADATAFDTAIRQSNDATVTADALDAMAASASTGYRAVARLTAAQLHDAAGNLDAARNSLATLAADGDVPVLYRDLARLLDIAAGLDDASADATLADLQPLAADGAPWRYSARELVAAAQLKAGDSAAATTTLQGLVNDDATPPALRARARELLAALSGDTGTE